MKNLEKTVKKILQEEKTTKKEMVITNEGVQRCPNCKGEGYYVTKDGAKVRCSHCDGAGFTYNKPARTYTGRNVVAITDAKKTTRAKKASATKVSTKKAVEKVREAEPLKLENLKFKSFTSNDTKYLVSNTILIKESLCSAKGKFTSTEDCINKILKVYFKSLKVETLEQVIDEKKGVLGVRYAVRKELPVINLSGKVLEELDYVQSALKLSKEVWIDIRYSEIFKNHRFIYMNPIKGKMIPVLCINKNTHKLDGIIMPLALS